MSSLLDLQVELYPTLLRGLAAGERLASPSEDEEKLAASLLVAETIEKEREAETKTSSEPEQEKKAIEIGLGTLALGGLALPKIKELIERMRGIAPTPMGQEQLVQSFRKIVAAGEEAQAAKKKLLLTGLGAAAAGALAVKALEGKKESEDNKPEPAEKKGSADARAVLSRLLKNFAA